MIRFLPSVGRIAALALGLNLVAVGADAQTTKMPSTLRYGSGIIDIPVASVLPHLAITGTYSGFNLSVARSPMIDGAGNISSRGGPFNKWMSDGSIALGLFDRAEIGASFQHFGGADDGGSLLGAFGRISILDPTNEGLGLAVGARYVTSPTFDSRTGDLAYQPNRLGYPDFRIRKDYGATKDEFNSNFSPYVVATAHLPGLESSVIPDHDLTLSMGWGRGTFSAGDDLDFYSFADSEGWFVGSVLHFLLGEGRLLNVMGEYNGFDVNAGLQLDWGGMRVGAFALGLNYGEDVSAFRSRKFGVLGSLAFCPEEGGFCKSSTRLIERPKPDTIVLPAPPADTVIIEREVAPPLPTGTPATMCLANGEAASVLVTTQGDTLIGPARVSIRSLRPGVVFAGTYAAGAAWFDDDESIGFQDRDYSKSGGEERLDCGNIMRVGDHNGVSLFASRSQEQPYDMIYVPVRPGVWQGYEHGLQRTRGDH